MYKVFIDHRPVVFISKEDLSTKSPQIEFLDDNAFQKEVKRLLKQATLDFPLQVFSSDPEEAFKLFFKKYIKIKASGGLVKRKDKYLLIKRNGKWDIPKGKIDKGEKKKDACVREIMEECGIEGHKIIEPLVNTYHVMNYKGRKGLKKTFWYMLEYDGPKATFPERKEGITKAKWMPMEYMLAIRGKTYGSINEVLDAFEKKYCK